MNLFDPLKAAMLLLVSLSGVRLYLRVRHRCRLNIMMLHGIVDARYSGEWKPLRPQPDIDCFEKTLRVLSRFYTFVSLSEAVDMLKGEIPVRPHSLVLTFDDGYRNNLKNALPIMHQYGVQPTIFLTTGNIENRVPLWFDRLDYALQHANLAGREFCIGQKTIRFTSRNRAVLREEYRRLRNIAKRIVRPDVEMISEMNGISSRLEAESGRSLAQIFERDDWSSLLTWDEVRRASTQGVSFGSHTVDHVRLGLVDDDMIRDQLLRSKEMIEKHTGLPCRYLCYPNGSFKRRTMEIARECGYEAALTTVEGANMVGDDLMALRRIHLPLEGVSANFLARLYGLPSLRSLIIGLLPKISHWRRPRQSQTHITGD